MATDSVMTEAAPAIPGLKERPTADNALARQWEKRIESARRHWSKFHKRIRHNRKLVSGFDWEKGNPETPDFYALRANLIYGSIATIVPAIYARNPEISVSPKTNRDKRLFCRTLATVINQQLADAGLKRKAKSSVMASLICSFGVLKVMYQRDMRKDPVIQSRIEDAQDNIQRVQGLVMRLNEPGTIAGQERIRAQLQETLSALGEQAEVVASEGMVIDRVLTENLLIDPTVVDFGDYAHADWMAQAIPMKREHAESLYGYRLDSAKAYHGHSDKAHLTHQDTEADDAQVLIFEIWDKSTQRVYTMAEGMDFWLREPYSPQMGERWYPFFLLPFNVVDGQFIAPSLVDLTERLQAEHNDTRDKYNAHRDLVKPGYIASADTNLKTLKNFTDSVLGEVTLIDGEGKPLNQVIVPRQHPPFDMAAYQTDTIRSDWEMTTGLQDAARSTVIKPKTATEANIMQQSLSGRVSSFRDSVEDWLADIARYTGEILVQTLTPAQVESVMGTHRTGPVGVDSAGRPVVGVTEAAYDWPTMDKKEAFGMVDISIRAGTTGEPDKIEQQESWTKLLPVLVQLVGQIAQLGAQGVDTTPLEVILRETVSRFDDRLDANELIPKRSAPSAAARIPGAVPQV